MLSPRYVRVDCGSTSFSQSTGRAIAKPIPRMYFGLPELVFLALRFARGDGDSCFAAMMLVRWSNFVGLPESTNDSLDLLQAFMLRTPRRQGPAEHANGSFPRGGNEVYWLLARPTRFFSVQNCRPFRHKYDLRSLECLFRHRFTQVHGNPSSMPSRNVAFRTPRYSILRGRSGAHQCLAPAISERIYTPLRSYQDPQTLTTVSTALASNSSTAAMFAKLAPVAALLALATQPVLGATLASRSTSDVFVPPVTYPTEGTVWNVGQTLNVTWYVAFTGLTRLILTSLVLCSFVLVGTSRTHRRTSRTPMA